MKELVEQKLVPPEVAALPDLGEIPPMSPTEEEGEEEDEEEDDEDEDEDNDSEEEGGRKRKRPARRSSAAITKRESGIKSEDGAPKGIDGDPRKRRGRPPRVDTPMEARIKAVLKGMRKLKNPDGTLKVGHFEKLPDKAVMPEYFAEIKNPMALDTIKVNPDSNKSTLDIVALLINPYRRKQNARNTSL
jgi:chromatin structure-remodeling complex subunit RSC1/2